MIQIVLYTFYTLGIILWDWKDLRLYRNFFFVKRSPEYREHQGPVPVYGQLDWRTYSKVFKPVHYKIIKKKPLGKNI